jgi:hypothetical protein
MGKKTFQKSRSNLVIIALLLTLICPSAGRAAGTIEIFDKPLNYSGYISQGVQFGIASDHNAYDTVHGFQSAILQSLLELEYYSAPQTRWFVSGLLNVDWAYLALDHDSDWTNRGMDKSKSRNSLLYDTETMLKECHVTFSPSQNFSFRVGKQVVAWGETDGVRLMDQINPQDTRRGLSDVKFETSIVPIWLVKADYSRKLNTSAIQDLGLEITYNPNAQFITNRGFDLGNDKSGIWSPYATVSLGGPAPFDYMYVGSTNNDIEGFNAWDPEAQEIGVRVKSVVKDTLITLNYFYGRDNSPITRSNGSLMFDTAYDGRMIAHLGMEGYYPRQRLAGFTMSRDFQNLYIDALGGISPVLRIEAFYGFKSTFATSGNPNPVTLKEDFVTHDEYRYAIGIDWGINIPWLNPRDKFTLSGQFIDQHILDYPKTYQLSGTGGPLKEDNYTTTLLVSTTYYHNKITPTFFWQRTYQGSVKGDLLLASLTYDHSHIWSYKLQGLWAENQGMAAFNNKDNVSFTVSFKF